MIHNNRMAMFIIMIVSGLLSTMNVWADKLSDIRWSINDIYMSLLMTGWMFLLIGIYSIEGLDIIIGIVCIVIAFICIRKQVFVNVRQYVDGMIPHHSMAVFITKQLVNKYKDIPEKIYELTKNIIYNQEKEIQILKGI